MNLEYMGSRTRMEGTPVENYDNFVREAMKANKLLKVYETVHEADPDVELIRSFSPATNLSEVWMTPQWMKWLGLFEVRGFVEWMLSNECHPRIYTDGDESSLGWAFDSLLGAMYLQMAWLLIAKEEVHCKQCGRVINYDQPEIPWEQILAQKGRRKPYKTRSDKEFCSKSCANRWYYEHVRKPRRVHQ